MADNWTKLECETIVADYFEMLRLDNLRQPFNKAAHNRALQEKLNGRSRSSIEFKHQNISAVLLRINRAYVRGYRPAWNYQGLLQKVVFAHLRDKGDEVIQLEKALIESVKEIDRVGTWDEYLVDVPQRTKPSEVEDVFKEFVPRHVNFAEMEARNRRLGERGESFVVELEKKRLTATGREDLADEVEWTSKEKGDGAGYDIRSFKAENDEELFIEVKTTNSGKYQPFLISPREVAFSSQFSDQYLLYRVFEFSRAPSLFRLSGAVENHVYLSAQLFKATF